MSEPWFDGPTAGLVGGVFGGLAGLWGGAVGTVGGWLVPRGRGRGTAFALLGVGAVLGLLLVGLGVAAVVAGQPSHVWYAFLLPGGLLTALGFGFIPVMQGRFRAVEEQRMARQNAMSGVGE